MEIDLTGRVAAVAAVAGESGGAIGAAVARRLAASGARVLAVPAAGGAPAFGDRLDILVTLATGAETGAAARVEALGRAAAAAMGEAGGRIVNIVSAFGLVPVRGEGALAAEAAAIIALSRALAMELGPRRVLVNGLAVGATDSDPARGGRLLSHTPLKRPASADEVAAAALFLADPANSYMTGHILVADGGWTAGYARDF